MKTLLSLLILTTNVIGYSQIPFEKDKKWGISRDGTGEKEDSIIFRADFEEVVECGAQLFKGLRNDEWQLLSSNKIVSQQRYQFIDIPDYLGREFVVCGRNGYIDLVSVTDQDFVVRGVKADNTVDDEMFIHTLDGIAMTSSEEGFGLINTDLKKEIVKSNYEQIITNNGSDLEKYPILGYTDGENHIINLEGEIVHEIKSENMITAFEEIGVKNQFMIKMETKKSELVGLYDSGNKWTIQPAYYEVNILDDLGEVVVVTNKKGLVGLFFQGKMLLECTYLDIVKSEKRGYLAQVFDKKGDYYVTPEGKLEVVSE